MFGLDYRVQLPLFLRLCVSLLFEEYYSIQRSTHAAVCLLVVTVCSSDSMHVEPK
jgi:hypothetical protein